METSKKEQKRRVAVIASAIVTTLAEEPDLAIGIDSLYSSFGDWGTCLTDRAVVMLLRGGRIRLGMLGGFCLTADGIALSKLLAQDVAEARARGIVD